MNPNLLFADLASSSGFAMSSTFLRLTMRSIRFPILRRTFGDKTFIGLAGKFEKKDSLGFSIPVSNGFFCYCRRGQKKALFTHALVLETLNSKTLKADAISNNEIIYKVKKKVALWVGYVGSDYKGLQSQRTGYEQNVTGTTIEDELEKALYKSGGILESNYGDLQKVSWVRSSRTDKGVHSLSTVISMKMEVPLGAWTSDSDGISLVESVNSFLPSSIKVFGIVPVNKSFDARRSCYSRTYSYLLPTEILGIYKHTSVDVRRKRIQEFQAILCLFEGRYPFHNYTARSRYRHRSPRRFISASRLDKTCVVEEVLAKQNFSKREDNEQSLLETGFETTVADEFFTNKIEDFREILSCEEKIGSVSCSEEMSDGGSHIDNRRPTDRKAWWVHEPDGVDKVGTAHFRKIYSCSCGQVEEYGDISYVQIFITGESFMLHQVRKIVGTAVAVLRGVLPLDIIQPSLSRHSRVILPLAPSEGLVLTKTQFLPFKRGHILSDRQQFDYMDIRLEMSNLVASKAEAFWQTVLLPRMLPLMDASKLPWTFWLETLESHGGIPAAEISELQIAWSSWKENNLLKKQQYHQDASS